MIESIIEFHGVYHVTNHLVDDDGEPLCDGRRESMNDMFGPHKIGITADHTDVCGDCREASCSGGDDE